MQKQRKKSKRICFSLQSNNHVEKFLLQSRRSSSAASSGSRAAPVLPPWLSPPRDAPARGGSPAASQQHPALRRTAAYRRHSIPAPASARFPVAGRRKGHSDARGGCGAADAQPPRPTPATRSPALPSRFPPRAARRAPTYSGCCQTGVPRPPRMGGERRPCEEAAGGGGAGCRRRAAAGKEERRTGEGAAAAGTAEPQLCPVGRAGMGIWAGGGEAMQSGWVTPGGGTGRERAAELLRCHRSSRSREGTG